MRPLTCCVSGCGATSDTHRLFCFPQNDSLRKRWLFHLVPTTSSLLLLSEEQLRSRRVCEKHFDKHQFDHEGRRIRYSYPCLFTDDEIAHGEPLSTPGSGYSALKEHNYYKFQGDNEDLTDAVLVIGRPGVNFHDYPSCAQQQNVTAVIEKDAALKDASSSIRQEVKQSSARVAGPILTAPPKTCDENSKEK